MCLLVLVWWSSENESGTLCGHGRSRLGVGAADLFVFVPVLQFQPGLSQSFGEVVVNCRQQIQTKISYEQQLEVLYAGVCLFVCSSSIEMDMEALIKKPRPVLESTH